MAKNMTRKGLALGAGVALVATGLAVPANAAGLADKSYVSLLPNQGTEYSVLADNFFDLKANATSSIATSGNLKFLVEDTTSKTKFDIDVNGSTTDTNNTTATALTNVGLDLAADANATLTAADGDATLTISYEGHGLLVNDTVVLTAAASGAAENDDPSGVYVVATVPNANTFTLEAGSNFTTGAAVRSDVTAAGAIALVARPVSTTSTTFYHSAHSFDAGNLVTGANFSDTAFNAELKISAVTADSFTVTTSARTVTTAVDNDNANTMTRALSTALATRASFANSPLGEAWLLPDNAAVQSPTGWDGTDGRKSATDGTYVVNSGVASATSDKVLRLVNTGTATLSVDVTAWVDANGNGLIDDTEYTSPTRTVVFTKTSEATFTTTMTAPALAATSVESFVNLGDAFNHSMMANSSQDNRVAVRFQLNAAQDQSTTATYDAVTTLLKATNNVAPFDDVAVGVYNAQARYDSASVGVAAYQTVIAGTVDIVNNLGTLDADPSADYNGTNLRTGAKSITLETQVSESGPVDARAGIPAKVTITKGVLSATSTISAGGKTLTSTGTSITYDTTTDADGMVVVPVTASTGAKTDSVTVKVEVLDTDAWRSVSKVLTWADAAISTASAVVHMDSVGSNVHSVAKGGTIALNYMVRDTFGQPFVASGYRLSFATSGGVTGGGTVAGTAPVVNGLATFNLIDNTVSATGNYTVRATLEKINTAGDGYVTQAGHTADVVVYVGTPAIATVSQDTAAMLSTTTEANRIALQTVDMKSGDGRGINITFPYTDNKYTVTGYVRASTGAPIPGQAVTISAAGAGIATAASGNDTIHGVGSLTVYTNASGQYTAYVYSNRSGKLDINVAAGSATASTVAYFQKAALTAGKTLTIDAPASVEQGSTLTVKANLADKYGNGVDATTANQSLKITYSGPGLLVNTPTAFVDGALQFGVLLGANDSGTATVTISVYTGTSMVSTTKTITIGTAGNTGAYSSWTKKLDDNSAKMYAKNVVGEGKVQFFLNGEEIAWVRAVDATDPKLRTANGSAYLVRTVEFEDGKNVLEIYVDGVRTTRTAYTK